MSRLVWGAALLGSSLASLAAFLLFRFPSQPWLALAPIVAALLVVAVWRLPLRTSVLCLIATVLLIHTSDERPADGMWSSPLDHVGQLLSQNINALTGISFAAFSVIDLWTCLLLAVAFHRGQLGRGLSRPFKAALLFFAAALAVMALHGALRGGEPSAMYWQVRYLVYLPALALLATAAARTPEDFAWLGRTVVWTALAKAVFGCYFYFAVALPRGWEPAYVTTHSDSMHFVLALAVLGVRWMELPARRHLKQLLVLAPVIFVAMVLNDRRLGWIGLFGALALILVHSPRLAAKRRVVRLAVLALPLVALYGAVGWNVKSRAFQPVQTLRSMVATEEDSSARWREFENYNLAVTLRRVPLTGQGLGLPYDEVVRLPSISDEFSLYRYIPHNSILWLLSIGGVLGLMAVLWPLWLASFFAARTLRGDADPEQRMRAQLVLCAVFVGMAQAFGDMGLHSLANMLFLALSVSAASLGRSRAEAPAPEPVAAVAGAASAS